MSVVHGVSGPGGVLGALLSVANNDEQGLLYQKRKVDVVDGANEAVEVVAKKHRELEGSKVEAVVDTAAVAAAPKKNKPARLAENPVSLGGSPFGTSVVNFENNVNWHNSYVRTRHKNVRCFPFCSPEHRDFSFCGTPITINFRCESAKAAGNVVVIGFFRRVCRSPGVSLGMAMEDVVKGREDILHANFLRYDDLNGNGVFKFMPFRRWRYLCEQNKYMSNDLHSVMVAVFDQNGRCIDLKDSPLFRISSAWQQNISTVPRPRNVSSDAERETSAPPASGSVAVPTFNLQALQSMVLQQSLMYPSQVWTGGRSGGPNFAPSFQMPFFPGQPTVLQVVASPPFHYFNAAPSGSNPALRVLGASPFISSLKTGGHQSGGAAN